AKIEKKEWEVKLVEFLARFDKLKESSKNLAKLIYSSMSTGIKLGLGFKEYIRSDEVFDLSTPGVFDPEPENKEVKSLYERFVKAGEIHKVPPPITGTFIPTSYKSDLEETKVTFGSKYNTSSINTSESNDFVSCGNSDKYSESKTYDFASCVSSPKTNDSFSTVDVKILPNDKSSASKTYDFASCVSSPKTNDSFSTVDVKILPKSDVKDPSPTNGFPSCSFKENVKPPRNLSYVPACSKNSSASTSAGRSIPAASSNRLASIHAGRHITAGRFNKPAPFTAGTKDETFYILKDFIALIENQLNKKVKAIRCDNGTEFRNAKLIDLYGKKGIKRDYSNARTPQQNKVAERKNRTLIKAGRSMVSITNPHNKTPYELLSRKVLNISHLKPFGCQVTILNTSDHLGKFKGKANEGFLVGYAANSKAYRVYNLSRKNVEETLNLRYLEDKPNVKGLGQELYFDLDYLIYSLGYTRFKTNTHAGTQDTNINAGTQDDDSESECDEQAILVPSFPSNSFSAEKYGFEFSNETAEMLHQAKIKTRRNLVLAAGDSTGSIVSTGGVHAGSVPAGSIPTSSDPASSVSASSVPAVPLPDGKIAIGTKWILKNKRDARGIVVRNKARLVAQGHRVVNALYGLHQAPRAWYARLSTFLLKHHYRKAWCNKFEVLMKGEFEMSAMGELTFFLGLQVKQLSNGIFISQDKYVKDMLKKFDMESVRIATTPYEVPKPKSKDEPDDAVNVHLYRSMIGSLMYLIASRPDIMFAVSACSRHQSTLGCSIPRHPMLLVVQVFLLVVLVHADGLIPAGSCTIPTCSYSFMLLDWMITTKLLVCRKGKAGKLMSIFWTFSIGRTSGPSEIIATIDAAAGAAAANEVTPPPPQPDVPPTHTSSYTPGPSTAAQDTLVRDPTPVREPTPSLVREPTTFREPTPEPPGPPSPPPCTRSEESNEAPPTTAATTTGGVEDSVALTDLSLKLDRVKRLEGILQQRKRRMVLSDSKGEEAAPKEHEIDLDALHELASASLGGDTTVRAVYTISKASQDAHASSDAGHDGDEVPDTTTMPFRRTRTKRRRLKKTFTSLAFEHFQENIYVVEDTIPAGDGIPANAQTIPAGSTPILTTGGVSAGSFMDPAGQAVATAPSSSVIPATDKGKAVMVDDSIPANLLTEQEQFARQQEELTQKAQVESVALPTAQGNDVNEDNMNERLGMLLIRKRRELAEQSWRNLEHSNLLNFKRTTFRPKPTLEAPSAKRARQGVPQAIHAASLQIPAAPSIAADVSASAISTTITDVSAAPALPAKESLGAFTHGVESQEESTIVSFTSGVSHATPSSSRRRRKQIAKKRVTPIVDVADINLIKFDSASESDGDPSPYAPYAGWEMVPTPLGSIHAYYDMEEHTKYFTSFRKLLHIVEKNDLRKLLGDSLADEDAYAFWRDQKSWRIRSWRLYPRAHVYVLETVDGRVIYMFVDVSYPFSEATFERMLRHGLEVPKLLVGGDLTMVEELVRFIKAALLNAQSAV
nr:ribonuclease H-like domain-containing protein [Tanacetum cinerariifolium]